MKKITLTKRFLSFLLVMLSCVALNAQTTTQTFTSDGTFVVPIGVTSVQVQAWGGGGAGGGCSNNARNTGGGGGGGAYRLVTNVAVSPGASINVTVGAGGIGVSNANGGNGGNSTFASGTPVVANGGSGGGRGTTLLAINGTGGTGGTGTFNGGTGGTGNSVAGVSTGNSGGGGGGAGEAGNGGNANINNPGNGGASNGGNGANGRTTNGNGDDATDLGGGGSGGRNGNSGTSNRSGGDGFRGQVMVTYAAPEMNVLGNAVAITDGDTTPTTADFTDFGSSNIAVGVTRTYTIQNTSSSAPLSIGSITFVGGNSGDFAVTTAPSATVATNSSTTFTVTFTPTAGGLRTTELRIANNDPDENPYNFNIQGTGIACEANILGSGISIADGDTTPSVADNTDFDGSSVGVGLSKTFTIENTGLANLTIGAITFSGTNAGDFTVTTAPSATVTPGSSTTFTVTFTPGALGARTAAISIVTNDSDENPYNFSIQGVGYTPLTYGPGGITGNLQLWLRSDLLNGTTSVADNTPVTTWNTQARGSNATKPAAVGAPTYRNNPAFNINFNSVVDFNNNYTTAPQVYTDNDPTRQYLKGPTGFYSQDMFVVMIPDVTITSALASNDIFCGDRQPAVQETDATGMGYAAYTSRMTNEVFTYCVGTSSGVGLGYGVADRSTTSSYSTAGILNARNNATISGTELTFNANNVINHTTDPGLFQNVSNSQYWIGRSEGWDGSLEGRVAEIITLSSRASDIQKSNIQSYLAVKYGITLGVNGTSLNYTNSDGNTIWDITANAGYNFDIAGIGRDDISRLNQKQSKSINPTEVMTIGLTDILPTNTANTSSFTTDKSYLVWGANGGTMVDSGVNLDIDLGPTTITTITEVVNRKWKLVETGGDVGTVRVNIPTASFLSGLPALGPTDAYVMVVATNSAFTAGLETVFMSTIGSNETCIYDFDGTKYITFGVAHRAVNPLHITLDGIDDFVRIDNVNELPANFTVMTWVRPNGANTLGNERTILSKKGGPTNGYQIVLQNDNRVRFEWYNGGGTLRTAITTTALPNGIWHNIAFTYTANTLSIYIDGVLEKTVAMTGAPGTSSGMFSIGGQYINKTTINNLFRGDIDELRMWSRVLSATEMRFILNQEILQNGTGTIGTVIPSTVTKNDISGLLWNNLYAYYSMNSYIGTHLDDDSINVNRGSLVIPDKISINPQTAPMPYESNANGSWATTSTWRNGAIQDVPYSLSIINGTTEIAWNIVRTDHNVTSNGNKDLLGLFVDVNTLNATNDSKIEITHYLKLDGKIDLVDKSQLIQVINSDLDPTSAGFIERDQQGTKNVFNYNYWSSPVGTINNTTNNNPYSVSGVMKDGTTTTPQNITWTSGLSGSPTNPITLSSYWIFKFQNLTPLYANWTSVGTTGMLNAGQGYTLKGSGAIGLTQNYTFVGKPNNGTITSAIAANNLNLSGNPYASAIDATQFITDNAASTTGSIYFWEHAPNNTTHVTAGYQGGYSARNLTGGVPPVAPAGITGLGSSVKIPNRYIPVGQGFFITGSAAGGTITFNNGQRLFIKEDNGLSNYLFKNNTNATSAVDHFNNNLEDEVDEDTFKKIRLGYQSTDNFYKQALLGFMESNATDGIDFGYDAVNIDSQANDLYFISNGVNLNIQGVGYFDANAIYPIGIKNNVAGNVTFQIDEVLNFDNNFQAFIHDNVTGIYHNVRNVPAVINVPQGTTDNRFSLRFLNNSTALGNESFDLSNGILVAYTNTNSILNIKNYVVDTTVESVALFNLLGQSVGTWDVENQNQQDIQLPISKLSTGTYIVKVITDKGDTSRKIIIK